MIRHCIRAVAIGLIIFPEPVSTAVGIALLSATLAIPRRYKRMDKFGNIDDLIISSFKIPEQRQFKRNLVEQNDLIFHELKRKPVSQRAVTHNETSSSKPVQPKTLKKLAPVSATVASKAPQNSPRLSAGIRTNHSAGQWFDNRRVPETVLHHTLKTSLPQYSRTRSAKSFSSSISPV